MEACVQVSGEALKHEAYLDPRTLAAVGSLDLRARMIVEGVMSGMHRSPYQGFSIEFAQHRQYAPGDDTRFLDWKVYGKTDKLYLKQYQQETNLDMIIMVDVSGSMSFPQKPGDKGDWSKFDYAATLAGAMSYLALRQQDRVALSLFSDKIRRATRLSNRQDHWKSITGALAGAQGEVQRAGVRGVDTAQKKREGKSSGREIDEGTFGEQSKGLAEVFDRVVAKLTKRSLLVLISDLYDDLSAFEYALARLSHRGHDLIVLQVVDREEEEFSIRQASDFIGLEGEGRLAVNPAGLRTAYLKLFQQHTEAIEKTVRGFEFDYLKMRTDESFAGPLSHFLAKRANAIAHGGAGGTGR
ncbi:DUF58 domain-containing protein [Poriferisphaera sp. WC338]|uniref:DUF58 domain-containing protein n=1 Tax=Poriferisphaera sp. WC338 TaxID=3425129 RepID=UPI003D817976